MPDAVESLASRFEVLKPHLNERQRRLWLGAEARELGSGGVGIVAQAVGVAGDTVRRGRAELEEPHPLPYPRSRKPGGGRKRAEEGDPGLVAALDKLVDPVTRGDPMSPLRWTSKSLRTLAKALQEQGHQVSEQIVRRLLREAGYSLQGNAKTLEGGQHPDRDTQFIYLADQAAEHLAAGAPVVSVDAKKKELVGQFKNAGQDYRPAGSPVPVNVHDFLDSALGKAIPYGVYDIGANTGWVSVGSDHDTAAFAVATLRNWWDHEGHAAYPAADRLLITADGGGSNGTRLRAWKSELAAFAATTGLHITVCHLPPGNQQVEQDRAQTVLAHHHELARHAADQPPSGRQPHRSGHHVNRPAGPRRTRRTRIPHRNPDQRRRNGRPTNPPPRLARRLELHDAPRRHSRHHLS